MILKLDGMIIAPLNMIILETPPTYVFDVIFLNDYSLQLLILMLSALDPAQGSYTEVQALLLHLAIISPEMIPFASLVSIVMPESVLS